MALVALVIGAAVSAAATERVTLSLVLTSALAWAFVPVIQLVTGCWLVRTAAAGRRVAALEQYFATHRAWSLFILGFHVLMLGWAPARGYALFLLPLITIPVVMTVRALTRLCREVLGMSAGRARRAVAIHQGMTYSIFVTYAAWASAYVPRIVGLFS